MFGNYQRFLIKLQLNENKFLAYEGKLKNEFIGDLGVVTVINDGKEVNLEITHCSEPILNTVSLSVRVTKEQNIQLGYVFHPGEVTLVRFQVKEENIKNKELLN